MWKRRIRLVCRNCSRRRWMGKILQLLRIFRSLKQVKLGSCCFFTAVCIGFSQSACGCILLVNLWRLKYMISGPHKFCTKWPIKKVSSWLRFMQPSLLSNRKYSNCSENSWEAGLGFCIKMSFLIWEGWSKLYLRDPAESLQQRCSSIAREQTPFLLLGIC